MAKFKVLRPFNASGTDLKVGDIADLPDTGRVRQLVDQRWVEPAPVEAAPVVQSAKSGRKAAQE